MSVSPNLIDVLGEEVARLARQAMRVHVITQLWTEDQRVQFRLEDGRVGDVEVLINWDVIPEGKDAGQVRLNNTLGQVHAGAGNSPDSADR